MYAHNTKNTTVNTLRYDMFRSRNVDVSIYQAAIWSSSLENSPKVPEPTDRYGWITHGDGHIEIGWISKCTACF